MSRAVYDPGDVPAEAVAAMREELAAKRPPASDPAEELAVLFPDRALTLGGVEVTVREYTFLEGLGIDRHYRALLDDLRALFLVGDGEDVGVEQVIGVLADHAESLLDLLSQATDQPTEWIAALSDADGQTLLMHWWAVNRDFFGRRLAAAAVGRALTRLRQRSASGASLPS